MYAPSTGGSHIETVTLELGRSKQSSSVDTVQEANSVIIQPGKLELMQGYASANPGGTGNDAHSQDANLFNINQTTGHIQSKAPLDFLTHSKAMSLT